MGYFKQPFVCSKKHFCLFVISPSPFLISVLFVLFDKNLVLLFFDLTSRQQWTKRPCYTYSCAWCRYINAHRLNSRCYNPCMPFVCTLLYTGSSVLQTDESPVSSVDKVPQAPACDWLLACLQVTLPLGKLHQSTLLILLIRRSGVGFFSLRNVLLSRSHFKSLRDWWHFCLFSVFCDQIVSTGLCKSFLSFLSSLMFVMNLICCSYFNTLIVFKSIPRSLKHTHTHTNVHTHTHTHCCLFILTDVWGSHLFGEKMTLFTF